MIYFYKCIFWITVFFLYLLKQVVKVIPALKKYTFVDNALAILRIWRAGDRYYQIFHILPNMLKLEGIDKNSKILYVGVQWYQWYEIKVLNHYYSDVTFVDINASSQKYVCGNPFIAADISKISQVLPNETFDCILISGIFYHYGLDEKFTNDCLLETWKVLRNNGTLITGITTRCHSKKIAENPILNTYFTTGYLKGKKSHKVYERLLPFKKTLHFFWFEIFHKKSL